MLEYVKALHAAVFKPGRVLNQPIAVNLDTSNVCNLSCEMCYRNESYFSQGEKLFLSPETLEKFYSQLQPRILMLGGISAEPLMNKDIAELTRRACGHGSQVLMTTNGHLLNSDLAHDLVRAGIHLIKVSLDAATPETYRQIRKSDFDRVLKNIKEFQAVKRDLGVDRSGIRTDFVIQPDNLDDVVPFIQLTKDLGASFANFVPVNFLQFTPETAERFRRDYDLGRLVGILRQALGESRRLGVKTNLANLLWGVDKFSPGEGYRLQPGDHYFPWYKFTRARDFVCMFPWLQLAVHVGGEVSMCCTTFSNEVERGLVLGNIHEDNLVELWNGERIRRLRRMFASMEFLKAFRVCQNCAQKLNIWNEVKMNNLFIR